MRFLGMHELTRTVQSVFVSGTVASVVSATALALLAKLENKGALQPLNATSHWLTGAESANRSNADVAHTIVGYATHHASLTLCALPFQAWLSMRPKRSPSELLGEATIMSGIAAVWDYGIMPRRFTPGWERVLSRPSMIAAYGALAVSLVAGARIADAFLERR
jgi:hypothetical protein